MKTLFKIAWRNCWVNPLRTGIVIGSITLGISASLFMMGFMNGNAEQNVRKGISTYVGHVQIHSKSYSYAPDVTNIIPGVDDVNKALENSDLVEAYSDRFLTEVSVNTARKQAGAQIIGIDVGKDSNTLTMVERLVEGEFFGESYRFPIVIGKKMAEEMKLELGDKVNLGFVRPDGDADGKNFKVAGIFDSHNTGWDELHAFVPKEVMADLLGEDLTHEVIIKLKDQAKASEFAESLQAKFPEVEVEDWRSSSPELAYIEQSSDQVSGYIMLIIIVALLFGVVNTIVMSILERKQELGVLRAIGMQKSKVKTMIMFESMVYGLVGGPLGTLIGWLIVTYFANNGLDLSAYAQGVESFGYDSVIFFSLDSSQYFVFSFLIVLSTFIAGLYPARIATKMNPVEAISSI